jgi:hypothetical protein
MSHDQFCSRTAEMGTVYVQHFQFPKSVPATYNAHSFVCDEVRRLDVIVTLHQEIALQSPGLDR